MSQLYPSALSSGIRIAIKKHTTVPSPNVPGPFHKHPHLSRISDGIPIAIKKNVHVPSRNVPKQTTRSILQKKHNVSCPKCRTVSTNQSQLLKNGTQKTSCPKCRTVTTKQAPLLRKETNKIRLSQMSPVSQAGKHTFTERATHKTHCLKCLNCPLGSYPNDFCTTPLKCLQYEGNKNQTINLLLAVGTVPCACPAFWVKANA